jgi:hypothetical protein
VGAWVRAEFSENVAAAATVAAASAARSVAAAATVAAASAARSVAIVARSRAVASAASAASIAVGADSVAIVARPVVACVAAAPLKHFANLLDDRIHANAAVARAPKHRVRGHGLFCVVAVVSVADLGVLVAARGVRVAASARRLSR